MVSAAPGPAALGTLLALLGAMLAAPRRSGAARLRALGDPHRRRTPRTWPTGSIVGLVAVAGLLAAGPGGAVAGICVAIGIVRGRTRRRAAAVEASCATELSDALHRITDELRAGAHPATALAGVPADGSRAATLLGPAAHAAALGDDVAAALRAAAAVQPSGATELSRVAAAWTLAERHGIPLAELLTEVHEDLRWRARFGSAVQAQLAGPRATAAVLTALPALGVALGQLVGADPIGVLRGGVLGQLLLVVGIGLVAAGRGWTAQILRRAVPR